MRSGWSGQWEQERGVELVALLLLAQRHPSPPARSRRRRFLVALCPLWTPEPPEGSRSQCDDAVSGGTTGTPKPHTPPLPPPQRVPSCWTAVGADHLQSGEAHATTRAQGAKRRAAPLRPDIRRPLAAADAPAPMRARLPGAAHARARCGSVSNHGCMHVLAKCREKSGRTRHCSLLRSRSGAGDRGRLAERDDGPQADRCKRAIAYRVATRRANVARRARDE